LNDLYETPSWTTRAILAELQGLPRDAVWLEPAFGKGAITDAVDGFYVSALDWRACDIGEPPPRGTFPNVAFEQLDFLTVAPGKLGPLPSIRVIITNSPFSLAQEFVEHALCWMDATVIMLLRLNFLGSQKRAKLFHGSMPDVYVLPKRPSFTGGGTDATEYAWMVWPAGQHYGRRVGQISVLEVP